MSDQADSTPGDTGGEQAFAPDKRGYGDQNESAGGSVLDRLYDELGRAHAVSEQLLDGDRQDLTKIADAEKRLMAERDESEQAGDTAKTQAIEQDLDRLREAYLTIKDRLGEDEQQDDGGQRGQRDGDGDDGDADGGAPDARAADHGDRERGRGGPDR